MEEEFKIEEKKNVWNSSVELKNGEKVVLNGNNYMFNKKKEE
jgi:hypothetical protein